MKKLIYLLFLISQPVYASSISDKIDFYADKYDVSSILMNKIMLCESSGSSTIRSMGIMKNEKQENSWGLFQINLDVYDFSIASTTDPDFNIEWAAKQFQKGNEKWQWVTCYRRATLFAQK